MCPGCFTLLGGYRKLVGSTGSGLVRMVLWSFLAVSLGKAPHLSEPVSSLVKWLSDNKPTLLVCYEDLVEHLEQWWVQEECSVNGRGDHDLSPGLPR